MFSGGGLTADLFAFRVLHPHTLWSLGFRLIEGIALVRTYSVLRNSASGPESAFRAGFWPDCYRESAEIGPPAG